MQKHIVFLLALFILSACSTAPSNKNNTPQLNAQVEIDRAIQLKTLNRWQVNGKIAFINKDQRKSGNITWYSDDLLKTQRLDLTTYLGINILHLNSYANEHIVEFNGNEYKSHDLNTLLYQLTGYHFPTQAIAFWLKGLEYTPSDIITYDTNTQLPRLLTSQYDNKQWLISYGGFEQTNQYVLPTTITIKQADITIKLAINEWSIK